MPPSPPTPTDLPLLLRRLTLLLYPPAFIILMIHGPHAAYAFPALGVLPLTASTLFTAFLLYRDVVAGLGSPIRALTASNVFVCDVALALFHLAMLIPSWALLTRPYNRWVVALGAYGTVFMMVDFGIHGYFALVQMVHFLTAKNCDCEHCRSVVAVGAGSSGTGSEYTPLRQGDADDLEARNGAA